MTTFTVPIPPSVNALYRNAPGKGRVKTERYRTWIQAAGWDVRDQKPEHQPGQVAVCYRLPWPTDKRKRDLGNYEKALSDLLVLHNVIEDDSKIVDLRLVYGAANAEGKALVEVRPA
jgi:crossover junction endodeoxyribonuclease RusA